MALADKLTFVSDSALVTVEFDTFESPLICLYAHNSSVKDCCCSTSRTGALQRRVCTPFVEELGFTCSSSPGIRFAPLFLSFFLTTPNNFYYHLNRLAEGEQILSGGVFNKQKSHEDIVTEFGDSACFTLSLLGHVYWYVWGLFFLLRNSPSLLAPQHSASALCRPEFLMRLFAGVAFATRKTQHKKYL